MKKIIAAAAALLISAAALLAQNPRTIYRKYSDEKGVSAVYISPAMFKLVGAMGGVDMGDDVDLKPIMKSLKGMYILNCEDAGVAKKLAADVDRYIDSGDWELLMEAKEDGETTRMYTQGDERTVKCFVLFNVEKDETNFICFEGNIPREDLNKAIAGAAE